MPRPKRTKVAPSAPARRLRQAAKTSKVATVVSTTQQSSSEGIYDISDPEEEVVTTAKRVKKSNGKGKEVMSRGRDSISRAENTIGQGLDLEAANDESSGGMLDDIDLDSSNDSIEVGRRDVNTPGMETSRLSLANFRRRPRQPSILGRGPARARSSSLESNLAEDNGLMSIGRRVPSAGNSRGRQRETSVDRQRVAPSSVALDLERGTPAHTGSVLNLGNFRRRQREPSILGTAQRRLDDRPDFDLDDDDFQPDDESTPLNFSRTRGVRDSAPTVASSSNSRKRKLSDIQVPQSSGSAPSPTAPFTSAPVPATLSSDAGEEEPEQSSQPSESDVEELPRRSIEQARSITPEPFSETMAPPQSSSSSPSSPPSPALPPLRSTVARGRQLRGRTPPPRTQDSPISSPPSLTYSPDRAAPATKHRTRKPAPPPSTYSTAQLQALMPQRRRRGARRRGNLDPFDVPSSDGELDFSGLASDDDELSHLQVRARTRRQPPNTTAPLKRVKGKAPVASGPKRVYGSRITTSDKENDLGNENGEDGEGEGDFNDSLAPLPDDDGAGSEENSQILEERVGKELKMAARKFKEVDRWELEFEDVTASSDSPRERDAR